MSDWAQIRIIATREFLVRARSRVFLWTMIGLSLFVIVGIFAASFIGSEAEPLRLGVAGDNPEGIVIDIESSAEALELEVLVSRYPSVEAARAAIEAGDVAAVLVDGSTIVSNGAPGGAVVAILTSAANAAVRREIAADLGLSEADVATIVVPVQVTVEELDPEDPEEVARSVASFVSAIVLLSTIMIFGQFVAMGIVEEKQNQVIEVILSKVKTTSLMLGKVLGIGALGLIQIATLGLAAVLGLVLAPIPDVGVPDLTSIGVSAVLWLGLWFILGYLIYSLLYATLGATISRQEDMQSIAFIPALMILPAYFLVSFTLSNPGGNTLIRIGSFVSIWSPILMPFRINTGDAALWEVLLAIVLVVVTANVLVRIGARVYRGAALRTGSKVSLRQAWNSADE